MVALAGKKRIALALAFAGLSLCVVMALFAARAEAKSTNVPCTGPDGGTQGLINAINDANLHGGGTITLAPDCTYTLSNGAFDNGHGPVGLPVIESAVTIDGNGSVIAREKGAFPAFRLMEVSDSPAGALTLDETKLRRGNAGTSGAAIPGGGAIFVTRPGTLTANDSVFTGNKSANGGAISSEGATVRVANSTFRNNHGTEDAGAVGGAFSNQGGRLIVNTSVLTGNEATDKGGAIHSPSGIVRVTNSTISNNSLLVNGAGGGIFTGGVDDPAELVIRRSTLSGNRAVGFAGNGGAIANYDNGTLTVLDSTISGNSAGRSDTEQARGGAIMNFGDATVTTTTIAGNRVLGDKAIGGGIVTQSSLSVTASIVANNPGRNCLGQVTDGGFNLEDRMTCGFADHNVHAEPLLRPLANYGGFTQTRALRLQSPAVNKVPPRRAICEGTVDQRGVKRPQGPACDIGSFELRQG
jgi:predicted outer membrane repeat protein